MHPYQYGYSNPALYTDPTGKCIPWIDSTCRPFWEGGGLNWRDSAKFLGGVAETVAAPAIVAYSLTQRETWRTAGRGLNVLVHDPARSATILREEWVDPVVRGAQLVHNDPARAVQILNHNPYELGKALGGAVSWGTVAKLGLRRLFPGRSLFFAGQVDELCTASAPPLAKWRWLPELRPRNLLERWLRKPGMFDPMTERFGPDSPMHLAIQNLDGSITDRTILYNAAQSNGGKLPSGFGQYSKYDMFDSRTYNRLLDSWYDIWKRSRVNISTITPEEAAARSVGVPFESGTLDDILDSMGWKE